MYVCYICYVCTYVCCVCGQSDGMRSRKHGYVCVRVDGVYNALGEVTVEGQCRAPEPAEYATIFEQDNRDSMDPRAGQLIRL